MSRVCNRLDHALGQAVRNHDFELHLGQEVDDIFGAAIKLGMALLSTKALGLGDCDARDADFMQRWLPDREQELERQTTPESWRRIVEALANPVQQEIVDDDRTQVMFCDSVLRRRGIATQVATSSREALSPVTTCKPSPPCATIRGLRSFRGPGRQSL